MRAELSKSFLDPWGNDGSEAQNVNVNVLLAEIHAGVPRWAAANQQVPMEWGQPPVVAAA